ncbi:MAG: SDR family NAD(P)-dependent oxidoreductase [Ruminococcaceae bacterium]|nr:SDR family NAD(P)-dependent oxidoreductase [Oscillospiraceae bacterium]
MGIAIVTGASSGMGREFVYALDKENKYSEIWVIARRMERLESLKDECKTKIVPIALDLTVAESFDTYRALLKEQSPDVTVLVNCSGFGKFGTYKDIDTEVACNMIDLNCKALLRMTEYTLPYMNKGSHILQLDSLSSFQPVPYIGVYGATKAFVLSYSRALNVELKPRGIKVMAICPGWVKTEFFERSKTDCTDAVTYYNVMYEAKDVVATAMKDMYKKNKDVSIHGLPVKLQVLGVKLLPHKLVMKIWMKQQKH